MTYRWPLRHLRSSGRPFLPFRAIKKIYIAMYKKYIGASEGTDTNPEAPALHI